jgi:hypothetical protein
MPVANDGRLANCQAKQETWVGGRHTGKFDADRGYRSVAQGAPRG